jgi:16S rRNA processing protein RimM
MDRPVPPVGAGADGPDGPAATAGLTLVVGRVGRPQGVRGEVTVEVRTDDPESRFAPGSVLFTEPAERGPLTVAGMRPRSGGVVVSFDGVADRAAAEALRGTVLLVDSATLPAIEGPDEFYDHQLAGLAAVDGAGTPLGTVAEVVHAPASDLLVVRDAAGREHLVPFVRDMVPTVDLAAGRVVVAAPEGLFDLARSTDDD